MNGRTGAPPPHRDGEHLMSSTPLQSVAEGVAAAAAAEAQLASAQERDQMNAMGGSEQLAAAQQQAEALREEAQRAKGDASRLEQALKDAELQLSAQCAEVARLQQERAVDVEMLAKAAAEAEELREAR